MSRLPLCKTLITCFALAGEGCSYLPNTVSGAGFADTNYLSYEHPFTESAAEGARKSAERLCAERKKAAVRTTGTCSLTRCTTHYQCMEPADAVKYRTGDEKK